VSVFSNAGPAALAKKRAEGTDPAHTREARRKQGIHAKEYIRANAEWEESHNIGDCELDFSQDILPGLQRLPLSTIVNATGLSLRYCSIIRRGLKVPHHRHWELLREISEE
jgi:hypothetical protein